MANQSHSGYKRDILKALAEGKIKKDEAVILLKNIDNIHVSWWASDEPKHQEFMELFHKVMGTTKVEFVK